MAPSPHSAVGDRKRAAVDLMVSLVVFGLVALSISLLNPVVRRGHGITLFLAGCGYQFTIEGLAPLALMLARRESFTDYGFTRRGLWRSLGLGFVLALIYDAGLSMASGELRWIPLARQPEMRMALAAGPLFAPFGIALMGLIWGFLEGFFGIYFARKVNAVAGHSGRGWLSPGVLAFAFFNGGAHLLVGQGLEGFLTSFASGYAIAVVPAVTANAWGGAFVQTLTDAAGRLR